MNDPVEETTALRRDLDQAISALADLHQMRRDAWPGGAEGRYRTGRYWLWVIPDEFSDNDDSAPF